MTRTLAILALLVASSQLAAAQVTEWTGTRTPGTDYEVIDDINVLIKANGTFKFQSVTGGNLDEIGTITIADTVTGTVTLFIERSTDDNSPGATNIGSIDLTNAHATPVVGNLRELRITGNLGTLGPSVVKKHEFAA